MDRRHARRLEGGRMDDVNTLKKGTKVELEHKPTYEWFKNELIQQRVPSMEEFAKHIAIDHLHESNKYYDYLEVIEDIMKDKKNGRIN